MIYGKHLQKQMKDPEFRKLLAQEEIKTGLDEIEIGINMLHKRLNELEKYLVGKPWTFYQQEI